MLQVTTQMLNSTDLLIAEMCPEACKSDKSKVQDLEREKGTKITHTQNNSLTWPYWVANSKAW